MKTQNFINSIATECFLHVLPTHMLNSTRLVFGVRPGIKIPDVGTDRVIVVGGTGLTVVILPVGERLKSIKATDQANLCLVDIIHIYFCRVKLVIQMILLVVVVVLIMLHVVVLYQHNLVQNDFKFQLLIDINIMLKIIIIITKIMTIISMLSDGKFLNNKAEYSSYKVKEPSTPFFYQISVVD